MQGWYRPCLEERIAKPPAGEQDASVDAQPILDREEAIAGILLLADILAKPEQIRRLLSGEEEEED